MQHEQWRVIPGYSDYQVSDQGRVKSFKRKRNCLVGQVLSPIRTSAGYFQVCLFGQGQKKGRFYLIHRLVMIAFAGENPNRPLVNHRNGVKTDNKLENLEWSTRSENAKHSFDTGLNKNCGETHYKAKLTQEDCRDIIERVDHGERISSIAKDYPVSQPNISLITHGKTWARIKRLPIIAINSYAFTNERHSKRSRKLDQTLLAA